MMKTKPFNHQQQAIRFMVNRYRCGLFMDPGLGKSRVVLDVVDKKQFKCVVIVCRKDNLFTWEDEVRKHTNRQYIPIEGTLQNKIKTLHRVIKMTTTPIIGINYDIVRAKPIFNLLKKISPVVDCVVVDESHNIKDKRTRRSSKLYTLFKKVAYKYLLTGTPATEHVTDLFGQMFFLDESIFGKSFIQFRYKYFNQVADYVWLLKDGAMDSIKYKLRSNAIFMRKEDTDIDFPQETWQRHYVIMSGKQKHKYRRLRKEFILYVRKKAVVDTKYITVQMIKLHQVAGGFVRDTIAKKIYKLSDVKLQSLMELICDHKLNHKIVVWCQYKHEIHAIYRMLKSKDIGCVRYHGGLTAHDRLSRRTRFMSNESCRVFVGQIGTGVGINELTVSDYCIYYSSSMKLVDRIQSKDRLNRIGTKHRSITYVELLTRNTIDCMISKMLETKNNIQEELKNIENILPQL